MKIKISQGFLLANGLIALSIAFIMLYLGFFFAFVLLSILSFINLFVFFKRRDEKDTFVFIVLIYAVCFLFFLSYSIGRRIYFDGGYITPAVVTAKRHGGAEPRIDYEFWEKNVFHNNVSFISSIDYKKLKERDTILVIYVKDNDFYGKIYKSFPTKEAIKKYREGVYYKKRGKIYKE